MAGGESAQRLVSTARALDSALEKLVALHQDVCQLAATRAEREWSGAEFSEYLALSREERVAERRYRMLRMRFDELRRRDNRTRTRADADVEGVVEGLQP